MTQGRDGAVALWRIASDTPHYTADDLSGKGAEITGGRWNRVGRPVVYTGTSISLAALETVVHLNAGALPLNRYLVRIDVPHALWTARKRAAAHELPVGWDARPPGRVSLDIGDAWLRSAGSLLYELPSVVVPEECNVLIDPRHADAHQLRATKLRLWTYDARIR